MAIIRDDQIQAAIVASLKANANILAEVDADQIKEIQPQTDDFSYPGIRVRVGPNTPRDDSCWQDVVIRILVFSEDASSQQCMRISGIIMDEYHNKPFTIAGLTVAIQFSKIKATSVPVIRQDRYTWRSEVNLQVSVSNG